MRGRETLEKHPPLTVGVGLGLLWLGVGTLLAVGFAGRIRDWSVMTDELLYVKLATSIADSGSPLPSVHGLSIEVYSQLYPLLLAPLFGALAPPDAFRAAHVLNAFVMASATVPAYLLARQVVPRAMSFAVAALTVLVPWMILTGFVMTEVVAYPVFLWAILALQVAIADPSRRHDLLAAGALALAVSARTQFAALAIVLPLAILGHEIGRARSVKAGAGAAYRNHRWLALLYVVGVVGVAIVAALDSAGGVLGVYAVTVEEGSLLPSELWSAAARHLDAVAIGCGLVPLILGGGWTLATVVRPEPYREHALATLSLVTVAVLTLQVASFVVRFGGEVVRDRYLFYVVPLLLVGTAAALHSTSRRRLAIGASVATIFFAATVASLPFTTFEGVWVDSPASVLNDWLIEQSGGLGTGTFVGLLGLFTGLVLVLGLLLAPRAWFAAIVAIALLAFSVLTLQSEVDRIVDGTGLSGRPLAEPPGVVLDWVDGVVPDGEEAALAAYPVSTAWDTTAIRWWDLELWNRRVERALAVPGGTFTYTPFPLETLDIDADTGRVRRPENLPAYIVVAPRDSRFQLAGRTLADNVGLRVRTVTQPARALWTTSGLDADGWMRPGVPARLHVHTPGRVRVTLRAPDDAPARYGVTIGDEGHTGKIAAGADRIERFALCGPGDVVFAATSRARIPEVQLSPTVEGTRRVGVLVGPISLKPLRGGQC